MHSDEHTFPTNSFVFLAGMQEVNDVTSTSFNAHVQHLLAWFQHELNGCLINTNHDTTAAPQWRRLNVQFSEMYVRRVVVSEFYPDFCEKLLTNYREWHENATELNRHTIPRSTSNTAYSYASPPVAAPASTSASTSSSASSSAFTSPMHYNASTASNKKAPAATSSSSSSAKR